MCIKNIYIRVSLNELPINYKNKLVNKINVKQVQEMYVFIMLRQDLVYRYTLKLQNIQQNGSHMNGKSRENSDRQVYWKYI